MFVGKWVTNNSKILYFILHLTNSNLDSFKDVSDVYEERVCGCIKKFF